MARGAQEALTLCGFTQLSWADQHNRRLPLHSSLSALDHLRSSPIGEHSTLIVFPRKQTYRGSRSGQLSSPAWSVVSVTQ